MIKRHYLIALLIVFFHSFCFGQDSITVNFNLRVYDPILKNAANLELRIVNLEGKTIDTTNTDSSGYVNDRYKIAKESGGFVVQCADRNRGFDIDQNTFFEVHSDTTINACLDLWPKRICVDYLLPPVIYFDSGTTNMSDSIFIDVLNEYEGYLIDVLTENDYVVRITSYSSYGESRRLAKKRGAIIYRCFSSIPPMSKDFLRSEIAGKKDLFVCEYCEGCHEVYKQGKGFTIDRKYFRSKNKNERERLNTLRSCVTIEIVPY